MDSSKKILLVEDDVLILRMLSERLREKGYEVFVAEDGEEGLERVRSIKPDLILLDLILPKLDGISLLRKIKEDESISAIPVLILTNLKNDETIEESIRLGASDYLVKVNYTPDELVEKIKETLGS